jgi:hypothetical protein
MNAKIFFETLAELYARQHQVEVASVTVQKKESPRTS